jgi:hypothetical protein
LKAISVDFWTDTLSNLEALSNSTGIPKNEIIRRGTEVYLLMYGVSEKETSQWLLESLRSIEKILSKRPIVMQELKSEFSKSTILAAALTSQYITYLGREQPHVLKVYFRTIQQHLFLISQPNAKLSPSEIDIVKEDIVSFANVVSKLSDMDLAAAIQPRVPMKPSQSSLKSHIANNKKSQGSFQRASDIDLKQKTATGFQR